MDIDLEKELKQLKNEMEELQKSEFYKKYLLLEQKIEELEQKIDAQNHKQIINCNHIFVITDIVYDEIEGRKYIVYYCPICGLTNKYLVNDMYGSKEIDDMNYYYTNYAHKGICASNKIIEKEEIDEYYDSIKDKNLSREEMILLIHNHFNGPIKKL